MAEPIGIQQLKDASLDVKSLEEVVNGDENFVVTTRLGETYPSVKGSIKKLFENGGIPATPFTTYSEMIAASSTIPDDGYAIVTGDIDGTKNGLWLKKDASWTYSKYNLKNTINQKSYLIAGNLDYQYYDKANDSYVISHSVMNVMLGSGRGFATIPAAKVTIPRNTMYYIDLNGIKTGDTVAGVVTPSDWNGSSYGLGSFVEDAKMPLFSYRTNGLSGRLVNSSVKQKNPNSQAIWFKSGASTTVTYDEASRTLSWSGQIVMPSIWRDAGSVVMGAHSVTFSTDNYQVAWIDLRKAIEAVGVADPTLVVKVSKYSGDDPFVAASYQVPIFYYGIGGNFGAAAGFFNRELTTEADVPTPPTPILPSLLVDRQAQDAVYLNAGSLTIQKASTPYSIDVSPNTFLHTANRVGKGVSTIIDKPSVSSTTTVIVDNDGYLHPSASNLLTIIPVYGQSNGTGYRGTDLISQAVTDEFADSLFMFKGTDVRMGYNGGTNDVVIDMSQFTDFEPLTAKMAAGNLGVAVNNGFAQFLAKKTYDGSDLRPRVFTFTASKGGQDIAGLQKGSIPYTNLISAIAKAKAIAASKGWLVHVPCVVWVHGEADSGNASYDADLSALLKNINTDVKAITNQSSDVQLLATQPSSFYSSHAASLKMIDADANNANIHLINPSYMLSYSSDFVHYTSNGHFKNGEYFAKAYRNLLANKPQRPLKILTVTRVDANTLDVKYDVVQKPLVIDATATAKDTNSAGFEIYSDGKKTIASSIVINQDTVRLTTSDAMIATGTVRYALQGQVSPRKIDGIPRGQLRDSDTTHKSLVDGKYLYNWAVHQSVGF